MNRTQLKNYAPQARREFMQAMVDRAVYYGLSADKTEPVVEKGDVAVIGGRSFPIGVARKRKALEDRIKRHGFQQTMEAMAYTWFNRLVAIRYMEMHGYLDHGYRVLSHPEGKPTPEILEHAEHVDFPGLNKDRVIELKLAGNKEGELYRLLLTAQCNALHSAMPFLFERIDDETELLLPDNLLNSDSLIRKLANEIDEADWQEVEIIGWLYQFYISEKKEHVFAALKKGKKITPENIPAATQLFTPHWIVRYLIENSLGRLWMLNHPDSRLVEQMDFYIRPEEPETDFLRISSPEEIKICDPACGSGHMLTYAFDLLYAIYEEQGYQSTEIPRLILKHNLYGVEIDQRAGALAAFALVMKARQKDRRFFSRRPLDEGSATTIQNPNVCVLENISIDPEDLSAYMEKVGRDLFSGGLQGVVNQWEEADNFGSLIRPLVTDVSDVLELLRERQMGEDLFLAGVHQKVLKALRQADYLSPKYHIVVANPPYMGVRNMGPSLRTFLQSSYNDFRSDLFSSFIVRNTEMALPHGELGFMSPMVWMFISSYAQLRDYLLAKTTLTSLVQLEYSGFEGATVPVCTFTINNSYHPQFRGTFIRLTEFRGADNQAPKTLEAIQDPTSAWRFRASADQLRQIPGSPIAYWVSDKIRRIFQSSTTIGEVAAPRKGNTTTDNARFLRFWPEVSRTRAAFDLKDVEETKRGIRWVPYNKGGGYRKWFGMNEFLVNWEHQGREIKAIPHSVVANEQYFFAPGLTWGTITSSRFSIRRFGHGYVFDNGGCCVFGDARVLTKLLGVMNSRVFECLYSQINPTLNFQSGEVAKVPALLDELQIEHLVDEAVSLAQEDWDQIETSWNYKQNLLVAGTKGHALLADVYQSVRKGWRELANQLKQIEEAINEASAKGYALEDEVDAEVQWHELSLNCNPTFRYGSDKSDSELEALLLADTMRELISYAVGCMMGRYSLDNPGLIYAHSSNQGFDPSQYMTFKADDDGIIPLLETDWGIRDDATNRFVEFIGVAWPKEHLEENLKFVADSLGATGSEQPRDTIRRYLATGLYKHHLSMYKKRPIYWLFSSGKLRAFQCLVYLHRYNEGTLARMRTEYVIPLQGQIAARIDQLEGDKAKAASTSHRNKIQKEQDKLNKQQAELATFEEKLKHYADMRISLDLDDGVKVNYAKFGDLLAESKAITGGKDDE